MSDMAERRQSSICTCGMPLNFCYMEWEDGKGFFKCVRCDKRIEAKRQNDHAEFIKLKTEWNGE